MRSTAMTATVIDGDGVLWSCAQRYCYLTFLSLITPAKSQCYNRRCIHCIQNASGCIQRFYCANCVKFNVWRNKSRNVDYSSIQSHPRSRADRWAWPG